MRNLYIRLFLTLCLMLPGLRLSASPLAEADSAYASKDYAKAEAIYTATIDSLGTSAAALFNLGNIYLKQDNLGMAMLCYQRAKKLEPSNSNIDNNIRYVASKVADRNRADLKGKQRQVVADEPSFFQSLHQVIARDCSSNMWFVIAVAAFILALLMWAAYLFLTNVTLRKIGFFSSFVLLFVAIVTMIFSFMAANAYESKGQAVITAYKTTLLSEPKEGAAAASTPLNGGTIVTLIEPESTQEAPDSAWRRVRLNHDFIGWTETKNLQPF